MSAFSTCLAQLRKESGISQKQAAAELGISQALLSHYEKGIRECGLAFLCRAAAFYQVSVDYLLGVSPHKQGPPGACPDGPLCNSSIHHVTQHLQAHLCQKPEEHDTINLMQALQLYKLLVQQTAAGTLPQSWVPDCEQHNNPLYLAAIDTLEQNLMQSVSNIVSEEVAPPQCVETLVSETQAYIAAQLKQVQY